MRDYLKIEVGNGTAHFESATSDERLNARLVDTTADRELGFCARFEHADHLQLCFTTDPYGERGAVEVSSDSHASERTLLATDFVFEESVLSGFEPCSLWGDSCVLLDVSFHGQLVRFGLNETSGIDSMDSTLMGGAWRLVDYEEE